MKILLNHRRPMRGMTYATVVVSMITIGTLLAAYLKLVSVQNQLVARSQNWNRAVPILEAGVEEAIAHMNKNAIPEAGVVNLAALATDGWIAASVNGPWQKLGWMGGDYYRVSISAWNGTATQCPTISSTGWVKQLPAFARRGSSGPLLAQAEVSGYTRRLVICSTTNNPVFSKGLIAKHGIDMNGNNVSVDSYDSSDPTYSTSGRWVAAKRRDHGDIASNDTITNTISVGNANIWGRVATGPNGTVSIGPNGKVGDAAWQAGGVNGIKPGYSTDDMNVEFPDVILPAGSFGWLPPVGSTLISGDYRLDNFTTSLTIADGATVRLRIDGGVNYTGNDKLTIGSNATLKIYLNCADAKFAGKGIANGTGRPNQCQIFGTSVLTSLAISGNGETTCVVYAPYADVKLNGGGSGLDDFSGALIANTFVFNGHYNVHYDEALGKFGDWRGFTITSWNEK
jgi:hypothetical protein